MSVTIQLTPEEIDSLASAAINIYATLKRDKNTSKAELTHWFTIQDKLMKARP